MKKHSEPDIPKVAAFQIKVAQIILHGYKFYADPEMSLALDKVIRYLDHVRLELGDSTAI